MLITSPVIFNKPNEKYQFSIRNGGYLRITSCKDENRRSKQTVDSYVVYVDSLENVVQKMLKANWSSIEATHEVKQSWKHFQI
jgi:hypothetical protein